MRMNCVPISTWLAQQQYHLLIDDMNNIVNGKCLYVGLRHDSCDYWYDTLIDNNNTVDILEIFQKNVDYLRTLDSWNIIQGDVTTYDISTYDCLYWIQGPEHVEESKLNELLPRIAKLKHYFLSVPNADIPNHPSVEQEPMFDNQYERHVSRLNKAFFLKFFPEECILLVDDVIIVRN